MSPGEGLEDIFNTVGIRIGVGSGLFRAEKVPGFPERVGGDGVIGEVGGVTGGEVEGDGSELAVGKRHTEGEGRLKRMIEGLLGVNDDLDPGIDPLGDVESVLTESRIEPRGVENVAGFVDG